jgi:hypothetical protein
MGQPHIGGLWQAPQPSPGARAVTSAALGKWSRRGELGFMLFVIFS